MAEVTQQQVVDYIKGISVIELSHVARPRMRLHDLKRFVVEAFGLFSIPSAVVDKNLSDTAGYIHWILAYIVIALAVLHSAAALKHHFVDRSSILKRMWSGPPRN